MRFLLLTWFMVIFILTCTKNVYRLLEGEIEFLIATNPHWSNLFTLYPWREISTIEFVGHFFMFFILTGLLIAVLQSPSVAVVIALLYGLATELLQPFFSRGAEGIDLLANIIGVISFVVWYGIAKSIFGMEHKKEYEQENERVRDIF